MQVYPNLFFRIITNAGVSLVVEAVKGSAHARAQVVLVRDSLPQKSTLLQKFYDVSACSNALWQPTCSIACEAYQTYDSRAVTA